MDEGAKKSLMIGIIVVCLAAAGAITYKTRRRGADLSEFRDQTTWVLCRNEACQAAYEMNLEKYHKYILDNADYRRMEPPALICQKCGEASVYKAVKCAKCGEVFEEGSVPSDFVDRCPKCGYSQIEENRRRKAEAKLRGE